MGKKQYKKKKHKKEKEKEKINNTENLTSVSTLFKVEVDDMQIYDLLVPDAALHLNKLLNKTSRVVY